VGINNYLCRKKEPVVFVSTADKMDEHTKRKNKDLNIEPSKQAQVVTILTCIQEVPGLNLNCGTDYPD
jgi:hypothetical protein